MAEDLDDMVVNVRPGIYTAPSDAQDKEGTNVVYIARPLTLLGEGDASEIIIDGQGLHRGIMSDYSGVYANPLVIDNFTIRNGQAEGDDHAGRGGGMLFLGNETHTSIVQRCTITLNHAAHGGGIHIRRLGTGLGTGQHPDLRVTDCEITHNEATGAGGGIYVSGRNGGFFQVKNTLIENNRAALSGGGIRFLSWGTPRSFALIENTIFRGNTLAEIVSNNGGFAFYAYEPDVTFRNVLMTANHDPAAPTAGRAIHIQGSSPMGNYDITFENCTLAGHQNHLFYFRRPPTTVPCRLHIVNSIMVDNGNGPPSYETLDPEVLDDVLDLFYGYNCHDLRLLDGPGNITDDPGFVDAAQGDYRLRFDSLCRDVGTNLTWMAGAVDLAGRRRVDLLSGIPDIGAYEYIPAGSTILVQ